MDVPSNKGQDQGAAERKKRILLAHYYQRDEVQEIADFTGDFAGSQLRSRENEGRRDRLCRRALHGGERLHLSPEKTVLLPRFERAAPWPTR